MLKKGRNECKQGTICNPLAFIQSHYARVKTLIFNDGTPRSSRWCYYKIILSKLTSALFCWKIIQMLQFVSQLTWTLEVTFSCSFKWPSLRDSNIEAIFSSSSKKKTKGNLTFQESKNKPFRIWITSLVKQSVLKILLIYSMSAVYSFIYSVLRLLTSQI